MKIWKLREEDVKTGKIKYSIRTHLYYLITLACQMGNSSSNNKIYHIEEEVL